MLYPKKNVGALKEQLPSFNIHPPSAAYGHVMSGGRHWLEPCWGNVADFNSSEIPLFFDRQYYGRPKGKENYYEFNQLVTHPLDLHWSEKRSSYCRTDELGDEVEIIKIIKHDNKIMINNCSRLRDTIKYVGINFLFKNITLSNHCSSLVL